MASSKTANGQVKAPKRKRGRSWDTYLKKLPPILTGEHRDVFEGQQLERSTIDPPKSFLWARVGGILTALFVFLVCWMLISAGQSVFHMAQNHYYADKYNRPTVTMYVDENPSQPGCFRALNPSGDPISRTCVKDYHTIKEPAWHVAERKKLRAWEAQHPSIDTSFGTSLLSFNFLKILFSLAMAAVLGGLVGTKMKRNTQKNNLALDTVDINQYTHDSRLAIPKEIVEKFDLVPDRSMHFDVEPSSLISHVHLTNKGVDKIRVTRFAEKDIVDQDGEIVYLEGEPLRDDSGAILTEKVEVFDKKFSDEVFETSDVPSSLRKRFDPSAIAYNPGGKDRGKGKYDTLADAINASWTMPEYETGRPAGAYVVDTSPVNTMVLAITRAGKGQTYIEPMIDMWLRSNTPNNVVINDPKGELLRKFFVVAIMRGYHVVQFNLIEPLKTDVYNPLGMASEAAREGDGRMCATYVENMAEVFFPSSGGDDAMWNNAANNAFKRAVYGMIDYYLEEERELRALARRTNMNQKVLETKLDTMWGQVTLYNCYQMFVQMSSKRIPNPLNAAQEKLDKAREEEPDNDMLLDALEQECDAAAQRAELWDGEEDADMFTLWFNATALLPTNSSRTRVMDANNSLKSMGKAEKMLASVYGIAITAMSFFVDPTISTLTSGTPSQNVDLGGLSFPRRMGVRFDPNFAVRYKLLGVEAVWDAFEDPAFSKPMGKKFEHVDTFSREGWCRYYFEGIFPGKEAWIRLRLRNSQSGMQMRTYYFHFTKGYQVSLQGRHFMKNPITGEKVIRDGTLVEVQPKRDESGAVIAAGPAGRSTFERDALVDVSTGHARKVKAQSDVIIANQVRYSEQPKAVFLVTPPHLMKYAKLILILITQLVNKSFEMSYLTKENQKPQALTNYMIDEAGNLQSEGQGIANFPTMLSIGLGQGQQFTIILQTLQQLRDVYGDSSDKVIQGNAQPLHAKIATPTGWKTMGEVQIGDEALTPDAGVAPITGIFPRGKRKVYKVTRRDGSVTYVCNEHLWEIESPQEAPAMQ